MMKSHDGFLLIELMIGLSLSTFFIVVIAHYIIEVKAAQQKALKRTENFSIMRNTSEKTITKKDNDVHVP